jgi:tetratricopeptide (TPR) repeat protein
VITVEKAVVLKPKPADPMPPAPPSPALQIAEARAILQEARDAMAGERYKEAEELFNRVRATGLEQAASLLGLAEVAFQRGSYAQSMHLGQRAVAAGGGIAAKMVLGNAYLKLGRYDDAINQYREVLRINGSHVEARSNLAVAEKRKGS